MKTLKYEPGQLCYWLEASGLFQNLKCSKSLGAARLKYAGIEAFISASGHVTLRGAEKDSGDKFLTLLSRCLWPAKYCMCNQPAIECGRGSCGYCNDHICEAIGGSYSTEGDFGKNIIKRAEGLVPALTKIEMLLDRFKELTDEITDNFTIKDGQKKNFEEQYDEINRDVMNHITTTKREQDAVLGIFVAGVAANVRDSIEKVLVLGKTGIDRSDVGALVEARNIVVGAFNALATSNSVGAINIITSYNNFVESNKTVKKEIIEIGKNGLNIAKLLSRPIPK